jgi:glycyl-tRNA synthetase beta chain
MPTLLLELFSEEIPSRMQRSGAEQLSRLMNEGFKKNMLALAECKTFVSPRHLAIQCFGLPAIQPDVKEERRGPKIGAPEQALKGFLQSTGLTLEQCEQRDGYYYATIERKGRAVAEVVKEICESALTSFVWPKSMKWGARPMQWVRPLHTITCLLDDNVVPVQFGHLTAGNVTHGHRFLAPAEITISHAEKYEALMNDANVIVDFASRRAKIAAQIAAVAEEAKLSLHADDGLLDEVTGLVEWPVPLLCEFDAKFLDLPPEVLISEMKNHQRYFALYGADGSSRHSSEGATAGKLTNRFITVANMVNADGGARVKDGNGRVVRARLADGEFYWNQDRLTKLEDWGKKLSDVVFHAKVGMMDEKVERIEALASDIADAVGYEDKIAVRRAAQLCKADLTSGMVGEFPELQGIMGRYYATAQGESAEIADAIRDHYKPLGANDTLPESPLAAIIAIADKLDSITSLFAAGEKPTGSKDPLALRRAALGVLRIALDFGWLINFEDFFVIPAKAGIPLKEIPASTGMTIKKEISEFFRDRLQNTLREEDIRHDAIEAIASEQDFNPLAIANRTRALATWLAADSGKAALAAIKRSMNILAAEEKKSKTTFASSVAGAAEPAEKAIAEVLAKMDSRLRGNDKKPEVLEALTAPINQFFTDLMVTEEGKREARLGLLAAVRDAANTIADFSKIEG